MPMTIKDLFPKSLSPSFICFFVFRIGSYLKRAMVKQWHHGWRTGNTGRFAHLIRPVVSVKPWFDGHAEERSFVTATEFSLSLMFASGRSTIVDYRLMGKKGFQ
jgi:hypothetical protein